ncbi:MAG TPA: hypothetical protein VFW44_13150, partial [Bryobacteraceae bacterium]|nr:hypothetical protein [Bryobacteraceae bacterium]
MQAKLVIGIALATMMDFGVWAQAPKTAQNWRGAGATPCIGSDGGIYQCPPAPQVEAIRAGHLLDTATGRMLAKQVIVISGDRIAETGAEGSVKIPA